MPKFEDFKLNISWFCPVCGSVQYDKQQASEGAITELWCSDCETTFDLSTKELHNVQA